jgi:hypothetical protein
MTGNIEMGSVNANTGYNSIDPGGDQYSVRQGKVENYLDKLITLLNPPPPAKDTDLGGAGSSEMPQLESPGDIIFNLEDMIMALSILQCKVGDERNNFSSNQIQHTMRKVSDDDKK